MGPAGGSEVGEGSKDETPRRPVGPDLVTCLLAELDDRAGTSAVERLQEIALASGGTPVASDPPAASRRRLTVLFDSASEAMYAAVVIGRTVRPARMALCTGLTDRPRSRPRPTTQARAAALLDHVPPDRIMTGAPTAIMAGRTLPPGAELIDRGSLVLGSGLAPERVYELRVEGDGAAADDDPPASNLGWARRAAAGPVPGFDDNRDVLLAAWRAAVAGTQRMVLLRGQRRSGKTSVAAELALRLHADGALVLYGRWDPGVGPYDAVREALGVYADACSTQQLRTDLDGWAGEIGRLLPDVGARIGARVAPAPPDDEPVALFEAVEAWLRAIARRRRTLLVLDDLHWADSGSLLLLDYLRHARGTLPLLTVVTVSPSDLGAGGPAERYAAVFDDAEAVRLHTLDVP